MQPRRVPPGRCRLHQRQRRQHRRRLPPRPPLHRPRGPLDPGDHVDGDRYPGPQRAQSGPVQRRLR